MDARNLFREGRIKSKEFQMMLMSFAGIRRVTISARGAAVVGLFTDVIVSGFVVRWIGGSFLADNCRDV